MRVVVADPPAYTPPYDYALAAALVREGLDVRLLTSRFRFGAVPPAAGYAVDDSLYGLSARLGGHHGRLAAKALGHPRALAKLARRAAISSICSGSPAPETDAWLLHTRRPLVFTAHDLLPRRTARRTRTWRRLFRRFDRIVTHSERGRRTPRGVRRPGLEAPRDRTSRLSQRAGPRRRRAHRARARRDPVVQGAARRVEAVLGLPEARLLVAGDPRIPLDDLRRAAGDRAEWRLGYLDEREIALALGAATVAVFPYRAELDQSGALLQAIGAGVPAVVYDVGGLGEIVGAFGAGRVVPPGDVTGAEDGSRGAAATTARRWPRRAPGLRGPGRTSPGTGPRTEHRALYEELV